MTVTYSLHVSKARLSGFPKLLLRWKGSIYKLLYREMIIFLCLYYALFALYRVVLNEYSRGVFEKISLYCKEFTDLIPLSFVLGFYVTIVVTRWWQQYLAIPWPDKCCMLISTYVNGADEKGRMIRRTLARYLNLMSALTFQGISTAVKKRFPTIDHLIEAGLGVYCTTVVALMLFGWGILVADISGGLMTKGERRMYDEIIMPHGKWWVPAQWFGTIAARARREGRIKDEILLKHLLEEMHVFRGNCGLLFSFDWISIPLVYTQVVTLAIYTYFLATLMGRQYLNPEKGYPNYELNSYVPVFTVLQFFFYMGWLKVAEQLINPFGEDDDDFEMNWCVDRNLQLSYNVVDVLHDSSPPLVKDALWDESEPMLPYTKSSFNNKSQPHLGSAMNLDINLDDSEFMPMETIMEGDREGNSYNSPPTTPSQDHGQYNFSILDTPTRKMSCGSIDTDNASVSSFRLTNFSGSRLVNMILGSKRELSHSVDSVKDGHSMSFTAPFAVRSPCPRRNSCIEPSPLAMSDGRGTPDQPLLPPFQEEKIPDENSVLLNIDQIVYQEKPLEYCAVKIPDLSVVEEESIGSSGEESPVIYPGTITLPLDASSNSDEADTSCESLTTSSDCQSTSSFSGLLENQV